MATLQNNGGALYIRERLTHKEAYCANGKILRNDGRGWKRFASFKPEVNVSEAAQKRRENDEKQPFTYPALYNFKKLFHKLVPLNERSIVLEAIKLLGNDPDGLWSELQDNWSLPKLGIEECCELCKLFEALREEREETRLVRMAYA